MKRDLEDLNGALGVKGTAEGTPTPGEEVGVEHVGSDTNEWESDDEVLQSNMTEDEDVLSGPDPVAPPILGEPAMPRRYRLEVERLADAAGPPPTHEKRRQGAAMDVTAGPDAINHCASVGVTEIEGKIIERTRKYAYLEALLAAESANLHNEPLDVKDAQRRLDWLKWKVAMQEELNSLEQHGTYKWVKELPLNRKAVGYKWVFKLKFNPDNSIA